MVVGASQLVVAMAHSRAFRLARSGLAQEWATNICEAIASIVVPPGVVSVTNLALLHIRKHDDPNMSLLGKPQDETLPKGPAAGMVHDQCMPVSDNANIMQWTLIGQARGDSGRGTAGSWCHRFGYSVLVKLKW